MNADEPSDWTGTPAALFAGIVLGLCSISGLAWSLNRTISYDSQRLNQTNVQVVSQSMSSDSGSSMPIQSPDRSNLKAVRLIDLNSADAAQLELLPRIGPALAGRIITDRQANGWFKSIDDLKRVSGIGPKTVEKIRAFAMIQETAHPTTD